MKNKTKGISRLLSFLICSGLAACLGGVAYGQMAANAAVEPDAKKAVTINLTVQPAGEPDPALRYRLLLPKADLKKGNAIPVFYTAITQLLSIKTGEGSDDNLAKWLDMPLNEIPLDEARAYLDNHGIVIQYIELGCKRDHCEWDPPLEQGFSMLLPELSHIRKISKIITLDARIKIQQQDFNGAMERMQQLMLLGKYTAEGPTLIQGLVGIAVDSQVFKLLSDWVQQPGAPNLYWALTLLPTPMIDVMNALDYERRLIHVSTLDIDRLKTQILSAQAASDEVNKLFEILNMAGDSNMPGKNSMSGQIVMAGWVMMQYGQAKIWLAEHGYAQDWINAIPAAQAVLLCQYDEFSRIRDNMYKWMSLPCWQSAGPLAELNRQMNQYQKIGQNGMGGNMLVMVLPALSKIPVNQARLERQVGIWRCIEAVRLYAASHDGQLPARLDDIKEVPIPLDSMTGKPFQYSLVARDPAAAPGAGGYPMKNYTIRLEGTSCSWENEDRRPVFEITFTTK